MEFLEFRFPLILAIDKIIYYIHLPFSYFVQNIGRGFDLLYGFQNEIYKLSIALFWSLAAITIFFKQRKALRRILLFCLTITFITIYIPQSTARRDKSNLGTYADYNYYDVLNGGANYISPEINNYYISDYSLHVKINRQLSVYGDIEIQSNDLRSEFALTLYHGYKVKSIVGDNLASFDVNGDTINLKFNNQTKSEKVTISYFGYNKNLYSNYQAAMLPGYFPWYPMAGIKQVYITMADLDIGNQGYNPYNKITRAKFEVFMDEVYFPYVINIPEKSKDVYAGESDSLTLIGGNIIIEDTNQYMNYLNFENIITDESGNQRIQKLNDIKKNIKDVFNYDAKFLDKKIIVCSTSLNNGNQYSGYSEFQDYIIHPGNLFNKQDVFQYYIYKSSLSPILKDALIQLSFFQDIDTMNKYMNQLLITIDEYTLSSKEKGDKKRYSEGLQLRAHIDEYIKKYGADKYLMGLGKKIFDEEKAYENFY